MSKPWIHSRSSAKKFGGIPEDYLDIHEFMDSSKSTIADNRHRALTHNMFWVQEVMIPLFGYNITNSEGEEVRRRRSLCKGHM